MRHLHHGRSFCRIPVAPDTRRRDGLPSRWGVDRGRHERAASVERLHDGTDALGGGRVPALTQHGEPAIERGPARMAVAVPERCPTRDRIHRVDLDVRVRARFAIVPGEARWAKTSRCASNTVVVPLGERWGPSGVGGRRRLLTTVVRAVDRAPLYPASAPDARSPTARSARRARARRRAPCRRRDARSAAVRRTSAQRDVLVVHLVPPDPARRRRAAVDLMERALAEQHDELRAVELARAAEQVVVREAAARQREAPRRDRRAPPTSTWA